MKFNPNNARSRASRMLALSAAAFAMASIATAAEPMSPTTPPMAMDSPALLTGSQEVPPVKTAAAATSKIVIGEDMSVTGSVVTTGIEGTVAHIHQGAFGVNGPPIITLVKTSATQFSVPAGSVVTQEQYNSYLKGDLYVNVHSAAHPSGEIRLQLRH